jgi:hypothetical protein
MRLTLTPPPLPLAQSPFPDGASGKTDTAQAAESKPPSPPQGASVVRGNSLRSTLLGKCPRRSQSERKDTVSASQSWQLEDIATDALASRDANVRELASAVLPYNAVIGHNGLTHREEHAAFEGFERPGFAAQETGHEAATQFLNKVFGSMDALATAMICTSSLMHHVACMAVDRGYVPDHTPVGLSTVADERHHFSGMQVGF